MTSTILVLFLFLLSTSGATHNMGKVRFILQLIAPQEPWTNTPIFIGRQVNETDLSELVRWLHVQLGVATYMFTGTYLPLQQQEDALSYHIPNDALTLFFCRNREEMIWFHLDKRLRHLRRSRLIVSLSSHRSGSHRALLLIFQKLWRLQFMNVLVVYKDGIYTYTPYPVVRYFELSKLDDKPMFPTGSKDLQGYIVSTPVENDLPRVFFVQNSLTGQRHIRGFAYRIFMEFLRHHNASLHVSNAHQVHSLGSSVNMSRILQLIEKQEVEISLHPYTDVTWQMGDNSYPLLIASNCLIVPVRNEIPRFMYLLRPFHWCSWLLLLVGVIYQSGILFYLNSHNRQSLSLCFLKSLCQLLCISPPSRIYNPSLRYFVIIFMIFILGFVITNWYCHKLGSFLTTLLVGEQVDSMEQLIEQQQKILVKHYEVETVLRHVKPQLREQVARLVVGVKASEQVSAFLNFNRSYAYPFTLERWEFLSLQQQYALKPIFRYSKACLGSPVIGYPMRSNSHLETKLKHFIMRIQDRGLLQHWLVSDFNEALKAGYVRLIDNLLEFQALDVNTLRLAWYVLLIGWVIATLSYVYECYK